MNETEKKSLSEIVIVPMKPEDYDDVRALWMTIRGFGIRALDDSREDIERFIENNPDCWTVYEGDQPYGEGWRYDADDKPLEWYQKMIDAFRYPNPYNNVGWYLDK